MGTLAGTLDLVGEGDAEMLGLAREAATVLRQRLRLYAAAWGGATADADGASLARLLGAPAAPRVRFTARPPGAGGALPAALVPLALNAACWRRKPAARRHGQRRGPAAAGLVVCPGPRRRLAGRAAGAARRRAGLRRGAAATGHAGCWRRCCSRLAAEAGWAARAGSRGGAGGAAAAARPALTRGFTEFRPAAPFWARRRCAARGAQAGTRMDDLLADFLTETNEGLVALDAGLVRLERAPEDAATLSEVFRIVHTIKGTCGFLGLPRLERVAHAAENVLGRYRDGTRPVTQQGISLILAALDRIRAIVAGLEATGAEPAGRRCAADRAAGRRGARAVVRRRPQPAAGPSWMPSGSAGADGWPEAAAAAVGRQAPPQTIRVDGRGAGRPDDAGLRAGADPQPAAPARPHPGRQRLRVPLQRLSHITTDLQEGVMKTRMQPIGNAWAKLPRLVRDLGVELGKKIALDDARRRDRAGPPGARADQGPADPYGPQFRRPRAGTAGGADRRRQAGDRPDHCSMRGTRAGIS